jgi:hypothetical protein
MSPRIEGLPIEIDFEPELRALRGKLVSGGAARGREVHAGSFLRRRRIVLGSELLRTPGELRRILVHELFHFVWLRLGNPRRRRFEELLESEIRGRARGELGWSAEGLKLSLQVVDRRKRTRRWRSYVCESFCDTGAWLFAGIRRHDEFTLAASRARLRRGLFEELGLTRRISL